MSHTLFCYSVLRFSTVEVLDRDAYKAFCAGLDGLGLEDALGAVQSVGLLAGVLLAVEPHERCGSAGSQTVVAEVLGTGGGLVQPNDAVLSELLGEGLADEVDELIIVLDAGIAGQCLNIDLAAGERLDALGDCKGMVTDDLGGLVGQVLFHVLIIADIFAERNSFPFSFKKGIFVAKLAICTEKRT